MMYPSFKVDDFPHAAKSLLDTQLSPSMFCGMTTLENTSRAAAEAYLSHQPLTKNDFDQHSLIARPPTVIHVPSASSVTTAASSVTATAAAPVEASVTPRPRIALLDVLQNFAMHLFVSTQTHNKVYEKLHAIGPQEASTQFMADTVRTSEKHKLMYPKKRLEKNDDVIWKAEQRYERNVAPPRQVANTPQSKPQAQYPRPTPKNEDKLTANRDPATSGCFNCGKPGHLRRDCKTCSFCRVYGHTAKQCADRIAKAKGKYCNECRISDSHDTTECYRTQRKNEVRVIQTENPQEQNENEWTSLHWESSGDEVHEDVVSNQH